jgi:hypothetical protein
MNIKNFKFKLKDGFSVNTFEKDEEIKGTVPNNSFKMFKQLKYTHVNNKITFDVPFMGDIIYDIIYGIVLYSKNVDISSILNKVFINITQHNTTKNIYYREEPYMKFVDIIEINKLNCHNNWYDITFKLPLASLTNSIIEGIVEFNTDIPSDLIIYGNYGLSKTEYLKDNIQYINISEYKYKFINNVDTYKLYLFPMFTNVKYIIITTTKPLSKIKFEYNNNGVGEYINPDLYRNYIPFKKSLNISKDYYIYVIPYEYNIYAHNIDELDICIHLELLEKSDIYITGICDNTICIYKTLLTFRYKHYTDSNVGTSGSLAI